MLAARYRRHYTVSIDTYRREARRFNRSLDKILAVLYGRISHYNYLCSRDLTD